MNTINESKSKRQAEIALSWRDNKGLGGVEAPPGFGKTYLILNFICKPMLERNDSHFIRIVVNGTELKSQWEKQIKEMFPNMWETNFNVNTVQWYQYHKVRYECSLLVLDEVDEYFSDDRSNIWNGTWVMFKWLFWASATPHDRQKRDQVFKERFPCIGKITMQQALDNKWIDDFVMYNLAVHFTDEEQEIYNENEEKIGDYLSKFDGELPLIYECQAGKKVDGNYIPGFTLCEAVAKRKGWNETFQGYYNTGNYPKEYSEEQRLWIQQVIGQWSPRMVKAYAEQAIKALDKRSELLFNATEKRMKTLELIEKYNRKTVVFSMRVSFVESTAQILNANDIPVSVFHNSLASRPLRMDDSGNPSLHGQYDYVRYKTGSKKGEPKIFGAQSVKELHIRDFQENRTKVLCVCTGIDKGVDIPDIKMAIISSNTSNTNQFIQRFGRSTRKFDEEPVLIFNLYIPGTREENNLKKNIKELPCTVYWINSVDEIDNQDLLDLI